MKHGRNSVVSRISSVVSLKIFEWKTNSMKAFEIPFVPINTTGAYSK